MSYRTTLVLVVVLVVLGAYLLWIEPRTRHETRVQETQLYTISPEQVAGIEVQSGEARVGLEREPGGPWRFADGRSDPVDQSRLSGLSLTGPTVKRTLEGVNDLGQFGLNSPQATISLSLQDGSEIVLHLGNRSPNAAGRYVQKAPEAPVYLVDDFWAQAWLRLASEPPVQPTPTPNPEPTAVQETPTP